MRNLCFTEGEGEDRNLVGKVDGINSNLLNMKRLSYPSYNLYENEEKVIPPFMDYGDVPTSMMDAASKFGGVVRGLRRPGHHIPGPTKNPSCPCDHCISYFEKKDGERRDQFRPEGCEEFNIEKRCGLRSRALSLGQIDRSSPATSSERSVPNSCIGNKGGQTDRASGFDDNSQCV